MAKSKIIKEIANKEISLEVAFNRLLIIASDIGNQELIDWSTNELNGYPRDVQVPKYRDTGMGQIIYYGINGNYQVKNQPLPYGFVKSVLVNVVSNIVWKILGIVATFGILALLAYLANN